MKNFDPYQMAIYLENVLALQDQAVMKHYAEAWLDPELDMIKKNTQLALADLREAFPYDVPNGKKD